MRVHRPASSRGHVRHGWLEARHTFSFGHYHDPQWMGFGPLRVINDDRIAAGGGFAPHRHANMEIITWVMSGALAHKDSTGGEGVIRPGEVQYMSAGHGVEHSEFSASDDTTHLLQIWIQPDRVNAEPRYAQSAFDVDARRGCWQTIAAPEDAPEPGAFAIRQQAWLKAARLDAGASLALELQAARRYWLHVAQGAILLEGEALQAGDAVGFVDESAALALTGVDDADVLLFDLPR